jgi:hypothetical protein
MYPTRISDLSARYILLVASLVTPTWQGILHSISGYPTATACLPGRLPSHLQLGVPLPRPPQNSSTAFTRNALSTYVPSIFKSITKCWDLSQSGL